MRRLLARLVQWIGRRWFVDAVPEAELRAFLDAHRREVHPVQMVNLAEARAWLEQLPEGRVLVKGQLVRGSGRMLLALDEAEVEPQFVVAELERLLKHVEVKRQAAVAELLPPGNAPDAWLERNAVAALFARHARRVQDLRFLNAALKLNDWGFRQGRQRVEAGGEKPDAQAFLLALVETETAVQELLA